MADQTYPNFDPKSLKTTIVVTFKDTDGVEKIAKSAARMADALGAAASLKRGGMTPRIYNWNFKDSQYVYNQKESTDALANRMAVDAKNADKNGSKATATPAGKLIEQALREAKIEIDLAGRAVRENALNNDLRNRLTRAVVKALATSGVSQQQIVSAWNEFAPKPATPPAAQQPQTANR